MEIQKSNLSPVKQDRFRKLLDHDGFDVLIEVLESKQFEHEVLAVQNAVKSTAAYDNEAKEETRKSLAIRESIKILLKLREQQDPFQVATAKPTTQLQT